MFRLQNVGAQSIEKHSLEMRWQISVVSIMNLTSWNSYTFRILMSLIFFAMYTQSSSNLDMFGIDSLQPTLLSALQGQGSIPVGSSYSSPPLTNLSGQQQHQQQQHDTISRGMSGMTGNTSVGLPLRGHSPHPVDAFSGLGSQNTRQPPQQTQTRRPY